MSRPFAAAAATVTAELRISEFVWSDWLLS